MIHCFLKKSYIGVQLINNIVLVSGIQQSDSVIHIHASILSHGGGNGNPLQYPCLENLMDTEAWWAAVQGVAKSWARLSNSHLLILSQILSPLRLLLSSEQSSLYYRVGPCWFSVLNIAVCTCQPQTLNLSPLPPFPLVTKISFSKSVNLFLFCRQIHLHHFFLRFSRQAMSYYICFSLSDDSLLRGITLRDFYAKGPNTFGSSLTLYFYSCRVFLSLTC